MSELRTAQRMDAGAERIDIKRKSLSAEGKLRVALDAMARGADVEAIARQHRVSTDEVARWRALAGDAALIALMNDEASGRDVRALLADADLRDMHREVRRHRLANAMLSEGLAAMRESFRRVTGVDPDDDLAMAELERARAAAGRDSTAA